MKKLKEIFMRSSIAPIIIGVIVGFIIAGVIFFLDNLTIRLISLNQLTDYFIFIAKIFCM